MNPVSDQAPDFRSQRFLLPKEAFAYAVGPQSHPTDLITPATWSSIMALPDDVSIRTTNHFGSMLKDLWWCWGEWTALAFTSLRAVIEAMTIGLHFQCSGDRSEFDDWTQGGEIGFGRAADKCMAHTARLEAALQASAGDDLFRQRTKDNDGGLVRRLFRILSHYAHGQPRFTDADIWSSNGPVLVPAAVKTWRDLYLSTYAVALLEARLAEPALDHLGSGSENTAEELFRLVVGAVPDGMEAKRLLEAVPVDVWHSHYV